VGGRLQRALEERGREGGLALVNNDAPAEQRALAAARGWSF
jgi:hypothetical protein